MTTLTVRGPTRPLALPDGNGLLPIVCERRSDAPDEPRARPALPARRRLAGWALPAVALLLFWASGAWAQDEFDFFSDAPVVGEAVVELPPAPSPWIAVGGPVALALFFFGLIGFFWWMVPFQLHTVDVNLHRLPTGVKRGIAMATVLFGIAFVFGASEIWYQLRLHGSAQAYFAQMSLGKLIAFTHAHLFGFTTSFFIIGIPFSLQFNHLWPYQWVFPVGLAASLTDVASWWGIKYGAPSFEWISMACGVLFSLSYLYMLVGLLRVLLFPEVVWVTDKDADERLSKRRALDEAAQHREGDY